MSWGKDGPQGKGNGAAERGEDYRPRRRRGAGRNRNFRRGTRSSSTWRCWLSRSRRAAATVLWPNWEHSSRFIREIGTMDMGKLLAQGGRPRCGDGRKQWIDRPRNMRGRRESGDFRVRRASALGQQCKMEK